MTPNEYQAQAMRWLNPALSEKGTLINGVMGLCGESGEVIDLVKKHLSQGHPLDREVLAKELGDVAWYLAETAYVLGYPLEEIFRMNLEKLSARYPDGFSTERSLHRSK
jgi:NTP pyrophosphatase (non-canonical NTP hydrolase)